MPEAHGAAGVCLRSRVSYPPYDTFLTALDVQRNRDFDNSFLSAREVKQRAGDELAEKALANHQEAASAGASAVAAEASPAEPAAANGSDDTVDHFDLESLAKRDLKPLENTCWVRSRVLNYLQNTPASTQNGAAVEEFLRESKKLLQDRAESDVVKQENTRLTVCELIQLINLRPASLVEIHRAIEECEERLTEEDTLALLDLIDRTLPKAPPRAGGAAAQQDEEDPEQEEPQPMEE